MTLWQKIVESNDRFFVKWRNTALLYWSNAMAGEVGEVCNAVKHLIGGGTHMVEPFTKWKVVEECVDVQIYITLLCESLEVSEKDFNTMADDKLEKIALRMQARMDAKLDKMHLVPSPDMKKWLDDR